MPSQQVLGSLERANLFLIPLDDQRMWYRYHHLFAEVLRTRLRSGATVELVATLHRRASAWYAQHDFIVEAVQHALAAADTQQVVQLLEQHGALLVTRGHTRTILGWLERLPGSLIGMRPLLAALHATVLLWTGQFTAAEARMQDAEQGLQANADAEQTATIRGWIALLRATLRLYTGDLAGSVALGERALELAPASSVVIRASASGLAARAYLLTGDVTPAMERRLTALLVPAQASGNLVSVCIAAQTWPASTSCRAGCMRQRRHMRSSQSLFRSQASSRRCSAVPATLLVWAICCGSGMTWMRLNAIWRKESI